ncbi:MAG TPA: hypothetical protein VMF52_04475, partial [Steroidobacteraceae bacterium]|nr:hypothetical protein [Steroidobacteraceae bacterium]
WRKAVNVFVGQLTLPLSALFVVCAISMRLADGTGRAGFSQSEMRFWSLTGGAAAILVSILVDRQFRTYRECPPGVL